MPKPLQRPNCRSSSAAARQKILALAARRGADRRHQREPAVGRRQSPDAAQLDDARSDRPEDRLGCARSAGTGSTISRCNRCSGSYTSPTTQTGPSKAMANIVRGVVEADAPRAAYLVGTESTSIVDVARRTARTVADVVHRRPRVAIDTFAPVVAASGRKVGSDASPSDSACRCRTRSVRRRSGVTRPASSRTSDSRRCSCPTTSDRSSRRFPRSRWPPRTRPLCGSARSSSTTTTNIRRSSPRKPRRSISSATAGSSSASARAG